MRVPCRVSGAGLLKNVFEIVISKWVTGETAADGIESWHQFCLRVERGIAQVLLDAKPAASAHLHFCGGRLEQQGAKYCIYPRRTHWICSGCPVMLRSVIFA